MDTITDGKPFHALMDELCATFRAGQRSSEAMRNAYWDALREVRFSEVKANAKRIMANATKDTPFPRPRDLRNQCRIEGPDARHLAIDRACSENWEALKKTDRVRYEIEMRLARAARELTSLNVVDPGYDEWLREYQQWAAVRYAPREAQEAAVARVTNQPPDWWSTQKERLHTGRP